MIKNGFLTFCFSFIPGAGQMYQGYMKRGLSQVTAFVLLIALGAGLFGPIAVFAAVVYMYSFFDSLNLRSQLKMGICPPDDYQFNLDELKGLARLAMQRHNLVGWGLVLLGVWGLYSNFIYPWVWGLADIFGYDNPVVNAVRSLINNLPTLAVSVVFVYAGVRLIRGFGIQKGGELPQELDEDFTEYKGE